MAGLSHEQRLRIKTELDNSGFKKGTVEYAKLQDRLRATTKNSSRALNRQGQAWTQLSYIIDDAQYGFRGVQNNIQQMAIMLGASGGLILGITAATVAINHFVEKWQDARKEAREYTKELAKKQGAIAQTLIWAEVLKTSAKGTDTHKLALKELKDKGYDPLTMSVDGFTKSLRRQAIVEAALAASKGKIGEILADEVKAREKIKELEAKGITKEDAFKRTNRGNFAGGALAAQYRKAFKTIEESPAKVQAAVIQSTATIQAHLGEDGLAGFILKGKGGKGKKKKKVLTKEEIAENFEISDELTDALENLEFANEAAEPLDREADKLAKMWKVSVKDAIYKATSEGVGEGAKDGLEEAEIGNLGTALQSSLNSAFADIGESLGEAFAGGFDGDSIAKIVSSFMRSFGAALIAIGTAKIAMETNLPGGFLIAAGVGLIAAAALFRPGGAGNFSKQGSRTGLNSVPTKSITPKSIQGFGDAVQLSTTVRGQDLRFMLQGANNTYNAKN